MLRYRYYVCQALLQNQPQKAGALKRVPAEEIEKLVATQAKELLNNPNRLVAHLGVSDGEDSHRLILAAEIPWRPRVKQDDDKAVLSFARGVIKEIVAGPITVQISFDIAALRSQLGIT